MDNWLTWAIVIVAFVIIVGNFSTFQKSAKTPLRKKNLNDLKETITKKPKDAHKMSSITERNSDQINPQNKHE